MSIALIITDRDVRLMRQTIDDLLQEETETWIYPDIPEPASVEMAVLWKQPAGLLQQFPNLQLVSSLGAGVEHILSDPALPPQARITRIVDEALTVSMRNYVLMCILNRHKQTHLLAEQQRERRWKKPDPIEIPLRIGILGMGELGGDIARTLAGLGFETWAYSRTPRHIDGVHCCSASELSPADFVARVNTLVCLLPRTSVTEGILNYDLFRHLPPGSALINVARGAHVVEEDLLRAFEDGFLQEAFLDVFREEPLPVTHPFWTHPGIHITPHIASVTRLDNAARIVADNYRRLRAGKDLLFEVGRERGY